MSLYSNLKDIYRYNTTNAGKEFSWENSIFVKDAFFCGFMFTVFNGQMWI